MLIHLHVSAVDAVFEGNRRQKARNAIENLLHAHHAQKHFVSLEQSAERLLGAGLSERARGAVRVLCATRKEVSSQRKSAIVHAEVGVGAEFNGQVDVRNARFVIQLDLFSFEDFERAGRAVLIAEDATDADIYVLLGRAALWARLPAKAHATAAGRWGLQCGRRVRSRSQNQSPGARHSR